MKILLDQGTTVPIRSFLKRHFVRTAAQQQWATLRNGDLLHAAEEAGFELLLTTDRNIGYQQNLTLRRIAILVIDIQQWPELRPHVQEIVDAVDRTTPGGYTELDLRRHLS
jgi:hypothetical protein